MAEMMLDEELVREDRERNAPELPPERVRGPGSSAQEIRESWTSKLAYQSCSLRIGAGLLASQFDS